MSDAERTALESVIRDLHHLTPQMQLLAADLEELGHIDWAVDLDNQARFWEWVAAGLAHDLASP